MFVCFGIPSNHVQCVFKCCEDVDQPSLEGILFLTCSAIRLFHCLFFFIDLSAKIEVGCSSIHPAYTLVGEPNACRLRTRKSESS